MDMLDYISENIAILPMAAFLLNTKKERDHKIPTNSSSPLVICIKIPLTSVLFNMIHDNLRYMVFSRLTLHTKSNKE